jgi:putative NADH-flavin reductase
MRLTIFGANGPTGRLLTQQSLAAGHETLAVTRNPDTFPLHDPRLQVVGADVFDQEAVDSAVEGGDVLLSALGVPFSKEPVQIYSRGMERILDAMRRHDVQRVVAVTSAALSEETEPTAGFLFNRVLQPYVVNKIGKTVYDDMRRMEELLSRADVDWTILRPSGLYSLPQVTDYSLTEERGPGRFTARIDLAHAILAQAEDRRLVRKIGHVITTENNPSLLSMMLSEARKK